MKIAILKEKLPGEQRIATHPEIVQKLVKMGLEVCIEKNAGYNAGISDNEFQQAGAQISSIPLEILADADILLKVQPDIIHDLKEENQVSELSLMKKNSLIIGLLSPYQNIELLKKYAQRSITSFAMEFIPRISRAQSMDVLSSQSNLAGYRAVIDAIYEFNRAVPMLMTAAGNITPAKILVIGAGVAGLQAIATAKRLGAVVSAFDVRAIAKEQVESLGAKFLEVNYHQDETNFENKSGYAKETSEAYKKAQKQAIYEALTNNDIVICTALIPGRPAPILITEEMIKSMRPGSIIVDLAAINGGNCQKTEFNKVTIFNGVKILGYSNFPSRIALDASKLYAKNLLNFLMLIIKDNKLNINLEDEVIKDTLITYQGKIVNEKLKELIT